jgi:hypothetical protein
MVVVVVVLVVEEVTEGGVASCWICFCCMLATTLSRALKREARNSASFEIGEDEEGREEGVEEEGEEEGRKKVLLSMTCKVSSIRVAKIPLNREGSINKGLFAPCPTNASTSPPAPSSFLSSTSFRSSSSSICFMPLSPKSSTCSSSSLRFSSSLLASTASSARIEEAREDEGEGEGEDEAGREEEGGKS